MRLDKQINIPVYVQLRTILKNAIISGEWTPGSQVPSEISLCEQYQVSRPTLRKAMDGLVEEGLLYRRRPVGTFVARQDEPKEISEPVSEPKPIPEKKKAAVQPVVLQENHALQEITFSLENSMQDTFLQYSLWRFEKETGIRVNLVKSGDWRENMGSIVNSALDKKLPDIFWLSSAAVPMFARCGLIQPLDDFLLPWQKKHIWASPNVQKYHMYCYDGKLYGFPFFSETRLLFYRREHLKQAGIPERALHELSHDSFLELCCALTRPNEGRWGFAGQMGYNADTLQTAMTFIIQRGGQLYQEKNGRLCAATSEPAFTEALSWYAGLLSKNGVCPPMRKYPHYQDISAWFMRGDISMAIERPTLAMVLSQMEDLNGKWGVAPLPKGPANGYSFLGGLPLCISSQCKNVEAAWKLVNFLTEESVNFPYLKRVGFLPPVELYDAQQIIESFPAYCHPFVNAMEHAVPFSYPLPQNILGVEMEEWNKPVQQILRQVVRGEAEIATAVEHLTWMLNSLFKTYT